MRKDGFTAEKRATEGMFRANAMCMGPESAVMKRSQLFMSQKSCGIVSLFTRFITPLGG